MSEFLNYWLSFYQIWILIGVAFLVLETADGSFIIYLPTGIAAIGMSILSSFSIKWYFSIFIWAVLSYLISYILSKYWIKEKNNKDINKYKSKYK